MSDVEAPDLEPRPKRSAAVLAPAIIAVLVVGFIVVVLATREPAANRVVDSPLVGRAAPELVGTTLDGDAYALTDDAGRFVLVNFFATWCVPCQREHDDLVAFDERHREIGDAAVVSVVFDDEPENARAFFEENGGDFPVLQVDNGTIFDFGVAKVPESYLVAPDGTIVAKVVGGVTDAGLEELLQRYT